MKPIDSKSIDSKRFQQRIEPILIRLQRSWGGRWGGLSSWEGLTWRRLSRRLSPHSSFFSHCIPHPDTPFSHVSYTPLFATSQNVIRHLFEFSLRPGFPICHTPFCHISECNSTYFAILAQTPFAYVTHPLFPHVKKIIFLSLFWRLSMGTARRRVPCALQSLTRGRRW